MCGADGYMRHFYIIVALALMGAALFPSSAASQDSTRRVVVKDVPDLKDIRHVSGANTHSGFQVPRYVSLKFNQVNGRQGPSLRHATLWEYQRRGLPLVVVAEMDIWRKVRDMHGDESWVRTHALSGSRHVITLEEATLRAKPKAGTRTKATAAQDTLLELIECNNDNWCRVKSESGHKGWVERQKLWGVAPL